MKIDRDHVFHWGTSVADMEKAVADWTGMGAKVMMPPKEAKGVNVLCCILLYHDATIELVAPSNEDGRKAMAPRLGNPGMIDHVAYFTDDMQADIKLLQEEGGQLAVPVTFNTGFDRDMAFLAMPTGLVVELMDRKARGNTPQDPLADYLMARAA